MLDRETEARILEFISNTRDPIHSSEISDLLAINRVTLAKYLSALHSKGFIRFKKIGMAKVWYPVENTVMHVFEINDQSNAMIQAMNALPDGICVLDSELNIVWLNRELEKLYGKMEKLKGKKCFNMLHKEKDVCDKCPAKKTLKTGQIERSIIKKGRKIIDLTSTPLKNKEGKIIGAIKIARTKNR